MFGMAENHEKARKIIPWKIILCIAPLFILFSIIGLVLTPLNQQREYINPHCKTKYLFQKSRLMFFYPIFRRRHPA